MSSPTPRRLIEVNFAAAAQEYLRSLPPEHFKEAVPQAQQRKITMASMDLVHAHRPDVQTFNELLIPYPIPGPRKYGQVVPDNTVVKHDQPIEAEGSYDIPLQPVGPLWVLEYVSKGSKRKDYEDSFRKYEEDLKVPYYLTFYPDNQELTLHRHNGRRYVTVTPNENGRYPIPDIEMEVAILDGWVRFWFRGELLPLPADLLRELEATQKRLVLVTQQLKQAEQERDLARQQQQEAERRLADEQSRLEEMSREMERLRAALARQSAPPDPGLSEP